MNINKVNSSEKTEIGRVDIKHLAQLYAICKKLTLNMM